jgi:PAS domain S-box-containing protein
MTHSTFDRWLLGAGGLIALLAVAVVLTFQNTRQLNEDAGWVAHTLEVRDTLQKVNSSLREAEAVQRTYLIVGGNQFPADFAANIDAAKQQVKKLKGLTEDNKEQQIRIPDIEKGIKAWEALVSGTMKVRKSQGFDAAQQIVAKGKARQLMADLQRRLQEMGDTERALLRDRTAKTAQTYLWTLTTGLLSGVAGVAGVVAFMVLLRRHLTARAAAAAVIAEQGERLRTTLASIGDAVITTDTEGRITNLNAVAESLTGWTKAEATGQPLDAVFRIVNEETREKVQNPAARALKQGIVVGLANHTALIARDGTERPIDDSAAPIRCKEGQGVGCVLVFRDISERRRLDHENASRLRAARLLAAIVESSDDAIISKSLDGIIQSWNTAAERLFGYTAEQAVGRHISLIIPAERLAEEDRIIATLKAGQRIDHFDTVRLRSDGQPILVSLTISPIKDDAGHVIGASKIARDITGQRQAQERERLLLAEAATANAKFRAFFDQGPLFAGVMALDGTLLEANRLSLEACGYTKEQVIGKKFWECAWWSPSPELMESIKAGSARAAGGELFRVEMPYFVADGSQRMVDFILLPIKDEAGRVLFLAPTGTDITDRKRAEDALREADRRKDEFLATLAHELRNPLAPIRNALQIIRLTPDRAARDQACILMQRQLEQMVRLVDDLLDVSRITRGKLELRREQVQLAAVINSAVETSRPMIDHLGHELTVKLPRQPIIVDADLTRLAQVFSNLLNNSAKYTDRGGHIWLTAERQGTDVLVSVRDTGIGIAANQLPHIFQMFSQVDSSLERSHGGLGIGLTLVKRLVEMHGGRIEARSEGLGKGAEFVVRLPNVVGAAGPQAAGGNDEPVSPRSSLRILIVDDNRDGADSLAMLLRIMGNDTRTAYDGQRGVDVAEEFRPDVVLFDIGLPKLNGYEACRCIREQPWGRGVVLIAVTGWGQEEDRRRSHEAGFDRHMVKPVDPQELLKLLAGMQLAKV